MADPLGIGGCSLWLDASVPASITATGGLVTNWADQSGNGRDATATTTARPTTGTRTSANGTNVLDFDGTANTMRTSSFNVTNGSTFAAVVLSDSGANGVELEVIGDVLNGRVAGKSAGNHWFLFAGSTPDEFGTLDTSAHAVIWTENTGSTAVVNVDGADLSTTGTTGTGTWASGIQVGAFKTPSNFWNGWIAEIVIYNATVLTSGQRTSLYNYFNSKWFLTPGPSIQIVVAPTAVHRAANW